MGLEYSARAGPARLCGVSLHCKYCNQVLALKKVNNVSAAKRIQTTHNKACNIYKIAVSERQWKQLYSSDSSVDEIGPQLAKVYDNAPPKDANK
jgi:hypothetical protein